MSNKFSEPMKTAHKGVIENSRLDEQFYRESRAMGHK